VNPPGTHRPVLVNVGCGEVCHPDWVNLDVSPSHPGVLPYDLRKGLPFPDAHCDACYSSHVLEHMGRDEAERFLRECHRVTKPKGVVRIVVPDLEDVARAYLDALGLTQTGDPAREADYDWMMIELYDQTVRATRGGGMGRYLSDPDLPNRAFVRDRVGMEVESYWNPPSPRPSIWRRLRMKGPGWVLRRARNETAAILVYAVAGRRGHAAFREGVFRNGGEIHRWMYDRFSLGRLLTRAGFADVAVLRAEQSRIPGFEGYGLDTLDGRERRPHSLFMEGTRP